MHFGRRDDASLCRCWPQVKLRVDKEVVCMAMSDDLVAVGSQRMPCIAKVQIEV